MQRTFKKVLQRLLGVFFWGEGMYTFWGGPPCPPPFPPKPPFRCPHPDKKGTNLLQAQIGIHLHTHQDLNLKCCRVIGQKLRYGRPCTRDLPGTHYWLAQSHIASIFQNSTILCWHNPGSLGWIAAPLAWLTPRPAPERVCLWLLDMSTDPPLNPILSKRCQSTGFELRIPRMYLTFRRSDPVSFWRGGQNNSGPPRTPAPLRFDSYIYQTKALDVRIPNI
jgi:hypothetical protein